MAAINTCALNWRGWLSDILRFLLKAGEKSGLNQFGRLPSCSFDDSTTYAAGSERFREYETGFALADSEPQLAGIGARLIFEWHCPRDSPGVGVLRSCSLYSARFRSPHFRFLLRPRKPKIPGRCVGNHSGRSMARRSYFT